MGRSFQHFPATVARSRWKGKAILVAAALLWVPAVGFGVQELLHYSNTPGPLAAPPFDWPHGAGVRPEPGRATLMVFAHPQCPCSRATIGELALIMAQYREKLAAYVVFYSPRSQGNDWARSGLWRDAASIPGVKPIEDLDGREALRFGASTSGQTLLYDVSGRLLFSGGITSARGHAGANDGRDAVVALLHGDSSRRHTTPAFGCSLLGAE
jgi:hypothetical protein